MLLGSLKNRGYIKILTQKLYSSAMKSLNFKYYGSYHSYGIQYLNIFRTTSASSLFDSLSNILSVYVYDKNKWHDKSLIKATNIYIYITHLIYNFLQTKML